MVSAVSKFRFYVFCSFLKQFVLISQEERPVPEPGKGGRYKLKCI